MALKVPEKKDMNHNVCAVSIKVQFCLEQELKNRKLDLGSVENERNSQTVSEHSRTCASQMLAAGFHTPQSLFCFWCIQIIIQSDK